MKKILSLVLALLMSASAASFVGAAEEVPAIAEEGAAADTLIAPAPEASQYDEAIKFLNSYGIYKGKSADNLAAADPIERYQMALFVARISTGWVDDSKWADVVADQWYDRDHDVSGFDDLEGTPAVNYLGALSYASQKGIIQGYGNKKFGPTDGITYQDALTMVVRTLGYGNNLAWPWGYIEKAVTIGLTKGISTSVKYTDKLNRGEVAQIIYNALFAPTALGDTLAARNFNGELGWETIIITGTGKGRFLAGDVLNDKHEVYDLKDAVAFRVVDVNGELKGDTYFVKNAEAFGFDEHTEKYLGYAFKALFTKDADSNYVTLVSAKPVLEETIWNYGLGKKAEDGDKWAIQDYLSGKTLVSKFSKNTYLNAQNGAYGLNNEFILKNALQTPNTWKDTSTKYAVDWVRGDILTYEKIKAEDATATSIKIGDDWYKTTVVWNYNDKLGLYFKIKTVDNTVVGIDILDEKDLEKLLESRDTYKAEGGLATITSVPTTAYASLKTFTLNDAPAANYGLYEEYRLGRLNIGDKDDDHGKKVAWSVEALDSVAKDSWESWNDADHPYAGYKTVDKTILEGECDHGTLWLSEESVEGYVPANGDYIIYSYDYATCELKVVKVIGKGDAGDKDNFVATGIVRAYSVPDKSVTIGENTYKYDYTELAGNGLNYNADKTIARAAYTDMFRKMFNQYVTYVVVDGKIVYIERTGETKNLIVVSSYAGLSSDGYIVVNGWNTADLKYGQFRIGAYDSWFKGDMYYYYDDARATSYFSRGALYTITSYDDKNDAYYVTSAFVGTTYNQGVTTRTYNFGLLPKAYDWNGNFEYNLEVSNGYKQVYYINPADGKKVELGWEKTKSSDKYIIMVNPDNNDWAPIIVFSGKAGNGWFINNGRKVDIGNGDVTFVLVRNWSDVFGFNRDQYDLSYVLFLGYNYESASYDGANGVTPYLLGASTYTARVFDIYTGTETVKVATNQKLQKGYVYPSYDGAIIDDGGYNIAGTNAVIPAAYTHAYVYGTGTFDLADKKDNSYFNKEVFSKKVLSKNNADEYKLGTKVVKDLCTGVKVFLVGTSNGVTINKLVEVSYDELVALNKAGKLASLDFWYIQKRNGDAVVYINAAEPVTPATPDPISDKPSDLIDRTLKAGQTGNELGIDIPAYIDTTFSGTANGKTVTLSKINLDYIGKGTTDTHKNVQEHKFYFGEFGYCSLETMEVAVDGDRVYGALHTDLYTPHADELDAEFCKLIKGVGFALPKNITVAVPEYRNGQFVAQLLNKDGSAVQIVPDSGNFVTGDPVLEVKKDSDGKEMKDANGDPIMIQSTDKDTGKLLWKAVYEVLTATVDAAGNNVVKSSPIWVRVQVADDIGNVFDIYYTVCVEATFYVNTGYTNNTLKGYNLVVEIDQSISTPAAFVPVSAAVK